RADEVGARPDQDVEAAQPGHLPPLRDKAHLPQDAEVDVRPVEEGPDPGLRHGKVPRQAPTDRPEALNPRGGFRSQGRWSYGLHCARTHTTAAPARMRS